MKKIVLLSLLSVSMLVYAGFKFSTEKSVEFFKDMNPAEQNKNIHIAVVGAGLAGLTAAYYLQKEGFLVDVYEARNRVGGRILSAIIDGQVAELGGRNFADGGEASHIRALAAELGIELTAKTMRPGAEYFTGDAFVSFDEIAASTGLQREGLLEKLQAIAAKSTNMKDVFDVLFEPESHAYKLLRMRLAAYEGADITNLSPIYVETLYHMLLGGIASAHPGGEEPGEIASLCIDDGNALLPMKIAEILGERLHLNKPLARISRDENDAFVLVFSDGSQVVAGKVVLAVPCSVYESIEFGQHVIQPWRLQAISAVKYGTNAKIIASNRALRDVSLANDRAFIWSRDRAGLLLFYYSGLPGVFTQDQMPGLMAPELDMLKAKWGTLDGMPTTYTIACDEQFAVYDNEFVGKSWPQDPFARGTYSYVSPGQEKIFTDLGHKSIWKNPFSSDSGLYFAGEHASSLSDVPGTMEAACESGARVAREISTPLLFRRLRNGLVC